MNEDDIIVKTVHEISDDMENYKYVIKYFSDNTVIEYWEKNYDTKVWEMKESYSITAGLDIKIFETAYKFLSSIKDRNDIE